MNIVIVGIGKVGLALTEQLSAEQHNVTIIDQDVQLLESIVNVYDVVGFPGNGACLDVLKEAGAESADLLIATASSDEINILSCLVAKKLGVQYTIARIRNPEYEKQLRFMRNDLGLSMIINPEKATAREIARILRFPTALKIESFSKGRIELIEFRVEKDSPLDGVQLSSLYRSIRAKVLICAVGRAGETFIPSGNFTLEAGDIIHLTASPKELALFFRHLGVFKNRASSVMIVGASRICYYLSRELIEMGMSVKIIDRNEDRCIAMGESVPRALVIHGDGSDQELLREEGIDQTDALVAITGLDEANILMALSAAKQYGCKVVSKINRSSLVELVSSEALINSVVSPASLTAELILLYVRAMQNASGMKIKTLHKLLDGAVEAVEINVPDNVPFLGVPLSELRLKKNLLIAGIVRQNGEIVIPSGQDAINANDDVIVITAGAPLQDLRDILEP